jgi:hypothetical protein
MSVFIPPDSAVVQPGFLALGNQAGLVVLDGEDARGWSLTAIGDVTLTPQNLVEGEKYSVRFTQDATGDRTLTLLGAVTAEAEGAAPDHIATFSTEYTFTATGPATWEVTSMAGGETLALVTTTIVGVAGIVELFVDPGQKTPGGDPLLTQDWATSQGKPDPANAQRTARWSLTAFGSDFSVARWCEIYAVGNGGAPNLPTLGRIDVGTAVVVDVEIRHHDAAELSIGSVSDPTTIRMGWSGSRSLLAFFGTAPLVAQQSDVNAFVDLSGGTVGNTIPAIPDVGAAPLTAAILAADINANVLPPLRTALASLASKMTGPGVDTFRTCLRNLGLMG